MADQKLSDQKVSIFKGHIISGEKTSKPDMLALKFNVLFTAL